MTTLDLVCEWRASGVRRRIKNLALRKRHEERDRWRQAEHAIAGLGIIPISLAFFTPDPSKWWNHPEAMRS